VFSTDRLSYSLSRIRFLSHQFNPPDNHVLQSLLVWGIFPLFLFLFFFSRSRTPIWCFSLCLLHPRSLVSQSFPSFCLLPKSQFAVFFRIASFLFVGFRLPNFITPLFFGRQAASASPYPHGEPFNCVYHSPPVCHSNVSPCPVFHRLADVLFAPQKVPFSFGLIGLS